MSVRIAIEAALGVYGTFVVLALAAAMSELLRDDTRFDVWEDVDPDAPVEFALTPQADAWLDGYREWVRRGGVSW